MRRRLSLVTVLRMMIAAIAIIASNSAMADNKKSDGDKPVTDSIIVAGYVSDSFLGMPVPAHITLMTADSTVIDTVSTTYTYQRKRVSGTRKYLK